MAETGLKVPGGEGVLAFGNVAVTSSPAAPRSALFRFDNKGVKNWTYVLDREKAWIRTIDQYKHALRTDTVVATVDDRLLIG